MTSAEPDADDTVRIQPPSRLLRRGGLLFTIGVAAVLLVGFGGWLLWPAPPTSPPLPAVAVAPAPAPVPRAAPEAPARPVLPIKVATESQIREHSPTMLTVFRFADNPRILVLDFPSLREQGRMLNRVAAFVEKVGLPRDRVLNDSELDQAIRAQGYTVDTFYYGHDYGADSLVRFFLLADRDRIELVPEEERLRGLLHQEGWFVPGVNAALISLTAVGADPKVTQGARAAILRHELSHGEFFCDPVYAEYVHNFWLTALTPGERGAFRSFLHGEDYDANQEGLMFNEMQAYLMFTRDKLFFSPAQAGLSPARLAELQTLFLNNMPRGWLRNALAGYQESASSAR